MRLFRNRSSNSSNFSHSTSEVGIVVVRIFGSFEILLMLFLTLAELLLLVNCWRANRLLYASIVIRVFSLWNCGIVAKLWSAPSFVFLKGLTTFTCFSTLSSFAGILLNSSEAWIIFLTLSNSRVQWNLTLIGEKLVFQLSTVDWFTKVGIVFSNTINFSFFLFTPFHRQET